jgi:hypothetical protein
VVAIAMVSDYVLNILILTMPAAYSPLATFLIADRHRRAAGLFAD